MGRGFGMFEGYNRRPGARAGFTLVELLVVVAIIGVLSAIAIPQFSLYRARAICSKAVSDLGNLAHAQEAYFTTAQTYAPVIHNPDYTSNLPGFTWTHGVVLISSTGDDKEWTAVVDHPICVNGPFTFDSTKGGVQ